MVSLPLFQIQLYSLSAMHPEKYTLSWHSYTAHLKRMMKELMMNEDYSDVTLVTEDKKHIKANINILSACSPVFRDILKKENVASTIIYLRGIQFSEMESIMHYVYIGEATFHEERMNEFLSVAKLLEIKELCNTETDTKYEPEEELKQYDPITLMEGQKIEPDNLKIPAQKQQRGVVSENNKYVCEQCPKTYSSRGALHSHKKSAHEGVMYPCDKCDYQATQKCDLTRHIKSKHEGVKYACDQCDYQTGYQVGLDLHIQSKHEGVAVAYDQCDYQSTKHSNLIRHINNKHEVATYKL